MRVGFGTFGFSTVTFRPSRVFHSRVFSRPSVDTDEQSSWKLHARIITNVRRRGKNVDPSLKSNPLRRRGKKLRRINVKA